MVNMKYFIFKLPTLIKWFYNVCIYYLSYKCSNISSLLKLVGTYLKILFYFSSHIRGMYINYYQLINYITKYSLFIHMIWHVSAIIDKINNIYLILLKIIKNKSIG